MKGKRLSSLHYLAELINYVIYSFILFQFRSAHFSGQGFLGSAELIRNVERSDTAFCCLSRCDTGWISCPCFLPSVPLLCVASVENWLFESYAWWGIPVAGLCFSLHGLQFKEINQKSQSPLNWAAIYWNC